MVETCLICHKDITREIPNDWNPNLCYACGKKDNFKRNKGKLPNDQRTLFDSVRKV